MKEKAKVIKMSSKPVSILVTENEFSKTFKQNDVDLIVSKGFDDTTGKHFLLCCVPKIESLNVAQIIMPFPFESEKERNTAFNEFGTFSSDDFIGKLIKEIKSNQEQQKKNEKL